MPTAKERLLGCAAEIIGCIGRDAPLIRAQLQCGGVQIVVMGEPPAGPEAEEATEAHGPPMPAPNAHWRWLSPLEEAILRALGGLGSTKVLSREEIAAACNEAPLGRIRGVLANLVERDIIDTTSGAGYFVKNPIQPSLSDASAGEDS